MWHSLGSLSAEVCDPDGGRVRPREAPGPGTGEPLARPLEPTRARSSGFTSGPFVPRPGERCALPAQPPPPRPPGPRAKALPPASAACPGEAGKGPPATCLVFPATCQADASPDLEVPCAFALTIPFPEIHLFFSHFTRISRKEPSHSPTRRFEVFSTEYPTSCAAGSAVHEPLEHKHHAARRPCLAWASSEGPCQPARHHAPFSIISVSSRSRPPLPPSRRLSGLEQPHGVCALAARTPRRRQLPPTAQRLGRLHIFGFWLLRPPASWYQPPCCSAWPASGHRDRTTGVRGC